MRLGSWVGVLGGLGHLVYLVRRKGRNPMDLFSSYPRNTESLHLLLFLPLFHLLPLVQRPNHILCVPPSLCYLLSFQVQSWYPVYIFLLPLFLTLVLYVDRLEIEWSLATTVANISAFVPSCNFNLNAYGLSDFGKFRFRRLSLG
jgi:hypothetical protein